MKRKRDHGPAPSVAQMRAGPAPTVKESGGKLWRLGWNNQDAKAALEMLITSELTRSAIKKMKALGPDGAEYFELFQNRVDSGTYKTFAPGWRHVMAGLDASWLFLLSLLAEHHPDATPDDAKRLLAEEPEQVNAGVGVIAPDFFAAVAVQMRDPKTVTAESAAAAGREIAAAILDKVFGLKSTPEPVID